MVNKKRILITGANGAVGRIIYARLAGRYDVTVIGGSDQVNLADMDEVFDFFYDKERFDVLIHCASVGTRDTESTDFNIIRTNLMMFENLKKHYHKWDRFINIASGVELSPEFKRSEYSLRDYIPTTAYALSKNIIAKQVREMPNGYNLRLFGIITDDRVFKKVKEAAYRGEMIFKFHQDKYMDYITEEELDRIIKYYVRTKEPEYKDINMVPFYKFKASTYVIEYIRDNNLNIRLDLMDDKDNPEGYCGDGDLLEELGLL